MLLLNPDNKRVKTDIFHRAEMHKTVMRLIPDNMGDNPREQANLLWRTDARNGFTQLFVQSTMELAIGNLPDGYVTTETQLDYNKLLGSIDEGSEIEYRIATNPTSVRTLARGDKTAKQRMPLHDGAARKWWEHRALQSGLGAGVFEDVTEPAKSFGKGNATLNVVNFSGRARVENVEAFRQSVTVGIGRGKAYGVGLLLAAPTESMR